MKTRRPKLTLFVLSLLVGIVGSPLPGGAPALAQSLTTSLTGTGDGLTESVSLTSSLTIPIAGTVDGVAESVSLSGSAEIVSTLVLDPLLGTLPREIISIKLVNVSGVGLLTGKSYVAEGEDVLLRLLVTSDLIEIAFPFYPDTPDGTSSARSALASITLNFDLLTGALTGGTAAFSTPNFAG